MDLLEKFKQYETITQGAKAEYLKYEQLFLADGEISPEENKTLNQLLEKVNWLEDNLEQISYYTTHNFFIECDIYFLIISILY